MNTKKTTQPDDSSDAHEPVDDQEEDRKTERSSSGGSSKAADSKPDPNWWTPWLVLIGLVTIGLLGYLGVLAPRKTDAPVADADTSDSQPSAQPPASARPPTPPAAQEPRISAAHILIGYKGSARSKATRSKEEAKKLAEQVRDRARKGEDFAELAKKHSDGPSGPRGGRLGQFTRKQMVKPFSDAAFALKPNQVSDVVETRFGFHVIKRL